ncbi:hypothetical protein Maq22A_c04805 [Methylobacterium aquaticum]|uniref:Uncharacterized protein n=1 Tax=Methylobacterium aquaticum TaxID=270351 RepID=A0A0C6FC00_9HYPH|nr:hypothetical protein Maq22A_c04805 [Methylobacterium aquaticum]
MCRHRTHPGIDRLAVRPGKAESHPRVRFPRAPYAPEPQLVALLDEPGGGDHLL